MTLTVHKLHTHCRYPKECDGTGTLVDEVVRGPLVSELNAQLGPSLDRLPTVVRVRGLRVEVKIPAKRLKTEMLAGDWARAFLLALHRALAYPDGDGASAVRRYQSQAEYNAALLQYLLTEGVSPTWQFPELNEWRGWGAAETAHEFLLRGPGQIAETLVQLARNGRLEPLLALWDELRAEQLIQAIAGTESNRAELKLESLIELGRSTADAGGLHPQWSIASRRQAIRLWSRLAGRFSLRAVWHGLRLLLRLLDQPQLLESGNAALLSDPVPFPQWCEIIVKEAATKRDSILARHVHPPLPNLYSVLADLRRLVPTAVTPGQSGKWIVSDCCGVLMLLSTVRRMDVWHLAFEPEFLKFGGPRALSFLLAAAGMTLFGEWGPEDAIDPAVALFAGIFSALDHAGLRQFFTASNVRAVPHPVRGQAWPEALDNLATEMARDFAQRVRGFRQASREAVVKQFIRAPGRVSVEEQRLRVVLSPNPWAVALHISGMDESLEGVDWLGGRRVEFLLEGL